MKKVLLSGFLVAGIIASAQVTGAKTIGVDYATIADAFAALNASGVGAGGATINVPAGYSATAPSGGFVLGSAALNSSLSAANPLIIQKSGSGANPLITAQVGSAVIQATAPINYIGDAIFNFSGVDYMTVDGIDLQESAANTTALTQVEKGYAFYNLSSTDGSNFNTVKNCSITFQKTINNNATGIYFGHFLTATPEVNGIAVTSIEGTNSGNKIYTNTITKSLANAINFTGFGAVTPFALYDQNNDIGGSIPETGNKIVDFGGSAGGSFYITSFAIFCVNQNNTNASNNNVQFTPDGLGTVGVYLFGTNSTFTANNNTVNAVGQTYGTTPSLHAGIYSNAAGTNLTASNNKVNISATVFNGLASLYGIYFPGTGSLTAVGNKIVGGSAPAAFYGIYNSAIGSVNISNNDISGLNSLGSSVVSGIYSNATAATGIISGNKIYNLASNGATSSAYGIYVGGSIPNTNVTIFNNLIGDLRTPAVSNTATSLAGIYLTSSGATSKLNVYYNSINLSGVSSGANFNSAGIYHANSATSTTALLDLRNNIINNTSTPKGTGNASAFRRSAVGVSNYAATSDNNDFYGTSAVYWNGTSANTLAQLQALSRDANSLNIAPTFLSTTGSGSNFLVLSKVTGATQAMDNKGAPIPSLLLDYALAPRDAVTPDLGAYEFTYAAATVAPDCTVITSPTDLSTGVTPNPTVLTWNSSSLATSYKLTIGTASGLSDVANETGLTDLSYSKALLPNKKYFAKVIATNDIGDATGCTEISFTTGAFVYCGPLFYNGAVEPIVNVNFAGINNTTSSAAGTGSSHEFFLNTVGTVTQNQTNTFSINGNTNGDFTSYYVVFIDWNQNGVLNDAGEVYFGDASLLQKNTDGTTSVAVSADIKAPINAKPGMTRMRIKKEYGSSVPLPTSAFVNPCLNGNAFGQAEDYTINVIEDVTLATAVVTKDKLSVYPNPFQDVLKISDIKGVKSISVSDISGRQLKNLKASAEINLSDLKTGMYIVTLVMEDGTVKSFKTIKK